MNMGFIGRPMGTVINFFYHLFGGNFFLSIVVFALIIAILRTPLDVLTQRGMAGQFKLRPQQDALRRKYPNDRMRVHQEMTALSQREGVKPLNAGCFGNLLMMPFLIGIFTAMRHPLTMIANVSESVVDYSQQILYRLNELLPYVNIGNPNNPGAIAEHDILRHRQVIVDNYALVVNTGAESAVEIAPDALSNTLHYMEDFPNILNLSFFGHGDLSSIPSISVLNWLWLIPIFTAVFSLLPAIIQAKQQKLTSPPGTPQAMNKMMYVMPLFTGVMAFFFPAALGIYWAFTSLFGGIIRFFVNKKFAPQQVCAKNDCDLMRKQEEREREIMERVDQG